MACFTKQKKGDSRPRCMGENARGQRCVFKASGYREGEPACGSHQKAKVFRIWRLKSDEQGK